MKNLKILIIAAVIGLASIGCAEEGGSGPGSDPTAGATALSGKVGLAENAADVAEDAANVADLYKDNEEVASAAEELTELSGAIENAETQEELDAASTAFATAVDEFIEVASGVATSEELAELNSSVTEFTETAGVEENTTTSDETPAPPVVDVEEPTEEVVQPEVIIPTDVYVFLDNGETCPSNTINENFICKFIEKIYLTFNEEDSDSCPESSESTHYICNTRTTVDLILLSGESCPADTYNKHYVCSVKTDIDYVLLSGESCPADTDTKHYVCTLAPQIDTILNEGETCPINSNCSYRTTVTVMHYLDESCPNTPDTDTEHYVCEIYTDENGNHLASHEVDPEINYDDPSCNRPGLPADFVCTATY